MNCKSVQNHLSAYLDRELSVTEMLAIRAHLSDCQACRLEADSLRSLKQLLAATSVPEPSADLADRLCASVLAHHQTRPNPRRASGVPFRAAALTFLGVAVTSMAATYTILSHASPMGPAPATVASSNAGQDLAFDVQRDQVYAAGLDATSGVPVLSTPPDAGR